MRQEYKIFKFDGSCSISSHNNLQGKGAVQSVDESLKYNVILKTGAKYISILSSVLYLSIRLRE